MTVRGITRHTVFHARTDKRTRADAWVVRGGFMVSARYGDPRQEALAAHTTAVLADFSPIDRLRIHGKGAARMLSAAFRVDADAIPPGQSRDVVWRTGGGGVRGTGTLVRDAATNFSLFAFDADTVWFQRAAPRFDATVRDESGERGVLLLKGPYAFAVLAAAGLEEAARLERGHHATFNQTGTQTGVPVTVGRLDPLGGFTLVAAAEHAPAVFDSILRAGAMFGLTLAGQEALEVLLLEAGVPLPGIDFAPARDEAAAAPSLSSLAPRSISPEPKISASGEPDAAPAPQASVPASETPTDGIVLAGIELESERPAPFAPVYANGAVSGHTMRSAYSPALRRAIALAQLPARYAAPGTAVVIRTVAMTGNIDVAGRVSALPFLS